MFTNVHLRASMLAALFASGCLSREGVLAKAQEAASELNTNARFGRFQLASEYVAAKERAAFQKRHQAWGGHIRVVDTELMGMQVLGEASQADVSVRVAWTFADDQDLRATTITQRWKRSGDSWLLVAEERAEGDVGLFGEKVLTVAPERRNAQFATVRIE